MSLWEIRKEVPKGVSIVAGISGWLVLIFLWFVVTGKGLLPPISLPHPSGVLNAFVLLVTDYDLLGNVAQSWWRIAQAFFWSAAIAIPLGIFMSSFRVVRAFVNPIAAPMRSMPITAFLPAVIALFGIDEMMKIAFLFLGIFFYLLAVAEEEGNRVPQEILETAYTLGARKVQVMWLTFRAAFPSIYSSFRILYDIGWTYVILAEIVNSRKGVGYMIEAARKMLDFDRVYAGIIAIGVSAFLFRWLLKQSEQWLFPWKRVGKAPASSKVQKVSGGS
jgi:NitT/TauT family transport system permease protein